MSDPLSDSPSGPIRAASGDAPDDTAGDTAEHLAQDLAEAEASKDLLQRMEELLATVSASLAGLGADLRSSAARAGTPDDDAPLPDAHG